MSSYEKPQYPVKDTDMDITKLAPKWSQKNHLKAALTEHLADAQTALGEEGDLDKEMADLYLIANAYRKSQLKQALMNARIKRFKETSKYPPLA
jgi:hypothetical protein